MAVDLDRTAVYIIKAHEQFDHRCFSGSCRTDDCDFLTFFYICREIVNDDLFRIVSEMNIFKLYISVKSFYRNRVFNRLIFFLFFEEFKHPLRWCRRKLKHVCHLSNLLDRLCKVSHILNKWLDISDFYCLFNRQKTSEYRYSYIT